VTLNTALKLAIDMKLKFLLAFVSFGLVAQVFANNIQVRNIELKNLNEVSNWVHIEFDLDWQNSWRVSSGPANWDAAWVFVKYRVNGGTWVHGNLSQVNSTSPTGVALDVTPDGMGAFVYRESDGSGMFDADDIQLRWNYGSTNLDDVIDIKVFAIEMVYIPQGSFYVGGTSGDERNKFHAGGFSTSSSYQITSEDAITIADSSGNLYYTNDSSSGGDRAGTLPAAFPKGFNAFYCMKYEVSEGQWLAFFNSLTATQQINRDITGANGKNSDAVVSRNTISWDSGLATSSSPDRAMSFCSPADMNAYMDWTGLRPMTELEYEKVCRGPVFPKAGEFAWGTSNITSESYGLLNAGSPSETIANPATGVGNAMYGDTNSSLNGPLRCGIFASSALNKNREETGGSYYGVMELSGNLYERCVSVGNAAGRAFTGNHGNGIISATGNGTVFNWPNSITGEGYSYRGGSWLNGSNFLRVSDRFDGATVIGTGNSRLGFRAVRTAP